MTDPKRYEIKNDDTEEVVLAKLQASIDWVNETKIDADIEQKHQDNPEQIELFETDNG